MKILRLSATDVHGYLPIDVSFFEDLTFITGLNGSGKTTALRLLMALLTPNLPELASIQFSKATVWLKDGDKDISIFAESIPDGMLIKTSNVETALILTLSEIESIKQVKRHEETRGGAARDSHQLHPVISEISRISTPMFLGLDRRFSSPGSSIEDGEEARRREFMARRFWPEEPSQRGSTPIASLIEVNYLVVSKMQDIRAKQEELDDHLRGEFFKKAFEYKPGNLGTKPIALPSKSDLALYQSQLARIAEAVEEVKIPIPEIRDNLDTFFERMSATIGLLDQKNTYTKRPSKDSKPSAEKVRTQPSISEIHLEWIINRPQVDRILEHLRLLNEFIEKRNELRAPITRFQSLVNEFLEQTGKKMIVNPTGQLMVSANHRNEEYPISALSSGERQLLIMLAHLSLSPSLTGSGVFIVDEPELSLHIDWQEKFVDAIRSANPNVQLILATHSPAIILDRDEACKTLNEAKNA
jgi:predicted ATP-binding protein involved in virulence